MNTPELHANSEGNVVSGSLQDARRPSYASDDVTYRLRPARRFSTGIGGVGNIAINDNDKSEETRALLDSSAPGLVLLSSPASHYGIGGFANTAKSSDADIKEAQENNNRIRRASLASLHRKHTANPEGKTNFAEAVRGFIGRRSSKAK